MMFKHLFESDTQTGNPAQAPPTGGTNLNDLRDKASALLSVGGEAIEKALSRDHQKFLEASRQQGGQ